MTWRLTPAEFDATRVKIGKINDRAVKRGFTGHLEVVGERVEVTRTNDLGFIETGVFFDTTITGTPPGYGGWTFLARVDVEDGGLIVSGVPGAPQVDRTNLKPGWCDHCQTKRVRRRTFVVGNDTGDQKQVGSTCVNDFLGWDGKVVLFTERDFNDDDYEPGGYRENAWSIDTILAVAWAVITQFGYVYANDYIKVPTKTMVHDLLTGYTKSFTDEELTTLRGLAPQADERAVEIREFIASDEFDGNSDYVRNLKTLVAGEYATAKQIGLLASAPQALIRHREDQVQREIEQAERDQIVNEWIGNVKDKVTLDVTVKAIRYISGQYGTTTLYTFLTDDLHVIKWFSSGKGLTKVVQADTQGQYSTATGNRFLEFGDTYEIEAVEGDQFRVTGTIKGHDEWDGQKQTVLTRVKGEPLEVAA